MNKPIISICIPLHNRWNDTKRTISSLIRLNSNDFDIVISDSSDIDENYVFLDRRVKVYKVNNDLSPMENWKSAIDKADGIFAMHLNDRDNINVDEFFRFINFLKENLQLNGGICVLNGKTKIFHSTHESIMNVPYFSYHPTGVFLKVSLYKKIEKVEYFTNMYGIHPHDILLGHISVFGNTAIYGGRVWYMPDLTYFDSNLSGCERKEKLFFEPEQRFLEYKAMIRDLLSLDINKNTKNKKKKQILRTYIDLSTVNYFYYLETPEMARHYSIQPRKLTFCKKNKEVINVINTVFVNEFSSNYQRFIVILRVILWLIYLELKNVLRSLYYLLKRSKNDRAI